MNPAQFCMKRKKVVAVAVGALFFYGLYAFEHLGRLSYPDFTIKTAMITTRYPGATPEEVEWQVTDLIEQTVQSMSEFDNVKSNSLAGISYVTVEMLPTLPSRELPQVWDNLRKKIRDMREQLPEGCGSPIVNDGFGDVYGIYYALTCRDTTLREADQLRFLKEQARWLKKELLDVDAIRDIAKIDFYGIRQEVIYLEIPQSRMAARRISPQKIALELSRQNQIVSSGHVRMGEDYVRITPTGEFRTLDNILETVLSDSEGRSILTLRDLIETKTIQREMLEPPTTLFRYNGKPAIAIGFATRPGGNVVFMGEDLNRKMAVLQATQWPENLEIGIIFDQAKKVTEAVHLFTLNLYESLGIVVGILMLFMGFASGLIVGLILLLTILGTFIVMYFCGITLQVISLGALIIALGMLVDNAIVVLETTLQNLRQGKTREEAAVQAVAKTQWPLLGATLIAILAFAAIGLAPDNIGEFCVSLFQVLAISLLLSWLTAVTVLPILCVWMLPARFSVSLPKDGYNTPFYRFYRQSLDFLLHHWQAVLVVVAIMTALSINGFGKIPELFFGDSTQNYCFIDYWRAEGTAIEVTAADTARLEAFLLQQPEVVNIASFIGSGSLRYILSYEHRDANSCFSQILIAVQDYRQLPALTARIQDFLRDHFPDAMPQVRFFREGPAVSYAIELEFRGKEAWILHQLADQAKKIFARYPATVELRDDWRQQVKVLRPAILQAVARRTGIDRAAISQAMEAALEGTLVGYFRNQEDLIPILWRLPARERSDVGNLGEIQVYSPTLGVFIPLEQIAESPIRLTSEDPILRRVNRKPAIQVQCNSRGMPASVLREKLARELEQALKLPPGYEMRWRGEYEAANKGKEPIARIFPFCLGGMFFICLSLFGHFRQPIIIFLTLPLAFIGVTGGLLWLGRPFEFLCIPGFLGLSGMLIKNAIILVEDTDRVRAAGVPDYQAVLDVAVRRMRPVVLASGTTILGMAPLLGDVFYGGLAATMVGGLLVGTGLTLVVLPIFYILAFRIKLTEKT